MNDTNRHGTEALGAGLSSAADSVDVGDAAVMLTAVRGKVATRRRRDGVLGVAAAGALLASGVVIANVVRGGDDDTIRSADSVGASTEAADDTEVDPPTTLEGDPAPDSTGDAVPVRVVPSVVTEVTDSAFATEAAASNVPRLLPWRDGFIAVRIDVEPQTREVVTTASVRFSTDGLEWSDLDVSLPDGLSVAHDLYSTGDRLLVVSDERDGPLPGDGPRDQAGDIAVYTSTDLVDWTRQIVAVPAPPADAPDYVRVYTYPASLVATDDRWLLTLSTFSDIDYLSLLDDDLRGRVENGRSEYTLSSDDDGITIEIYPVDIDAIAAEDLDEVLDGGSEIVLPDPLDPSNRPGPAERIRLTWNDLGLDGRPVDVNGEASVTTWTSNWVDNPVESPGASIDGPGWYPMGVTDSGFVASGEQGVRYSPDGLTWSDVALPVDGYAETLLPLSDGVVAFVSEWSGDRSVHLLDVPTMAWTALEIDGLPEGFFVERAVSGAVTLQETDGDYFDGWADVRTSVGTAEVGGYRVELRSSVSGNTMAVGYTITDVATGEIVSAESAEAIAEPYVDESPFDFAEESYEVDGEEGVIFFDPATGEKLVAVPFDAMTYAQLDAEGQPIEMPTADTMLAEEMMIPGRWLVASDGTTWIVEQLSAPTTVDNEEAAMASETGDLAVNNGVVLVVKYDGSFLRYEIA